MGRMNDISIDMSKHNKILIDMVKAAGQELIDRAEEKVKDEIFDPEKGLSMAIAKKVFGNKGNYYNEFKKWIPKHYE